VTTKRSALIGLIEGGSIPSGKIQDAIAIAGIQPAGDAWRRFVDHLLLWLGGLALAFAVMFFVAYNWNELGRFARFAMVEALMALAVIACWKFGADRVAGKVLLLVATILLGVLLALFGQTYQTGADPWQLFFTWALMMLPWALVGRFAAIWIVWVTLINLSIVLYHQAFRGLFWMAFDSDLGMLWVLFAFNTLVLFAWEHLSSVWNWLAERWAPRLLAIAAGVAITWLVLYAILDTGANEFAAVPVWALWLGAIYYYYTKYRPDLFMLAGICMSAIVVVVTFFARHLLREGGDPGSFLFLAILVIGMGAGAAVWLRKKHREMHP